MTTTVVYGNLWEIVLLYPDNYKKKYSKKIQHMIEIYLCSDMGTSNIWTNEMKLKILTHCAWHVVQIGPTITPYPLIRLFVCSFNDFILKGVFL